MMAGIHLVCNGDRDIPHLKRGIAIELYARFSLAEVPIVSTPRPVSHKGDLAILMSGKTKHTACTGANGVCYPRND